MKKLKLILLILVFALTANSQTDTIIKSRVDAQTMGGFAPSFYLDTTDIMKTNIIYVDAGYVGRISSDGSLKAPYKTILAAQTYINTNSATLATAGNYPDSKYIVKIAPNTYADNLVINNQKYLRYEMAGSIISGTVDITTSQQTGDYYSKIEFWGGMSNRPEKGDNGEISGVITCTRNNDALQYLSFTGMEISDNLLFETNGTWVVFLNHAYFSNGSAFISGDFSGAGVPTVLVESMGLTRIKAHITDTDASATNVALYDCSNTEFDLINSSSTFGGILRNCTFKSDVTISAGTYKIDNVSYKEITAQAEDLTGATVNYLDWELSTDGTLAGNLDTKTVSEKAIKTFVAASITAEDLDFAGDAGTGAVDLDSQTFTIAGTANEIETTAANQTLTIGLPTLTILPDGTTATTQSVGDNSTKVATTAYVDVLQLFQGLTWDSDSDTYTRLGSLVGIATSTSAGDDYLPIQSDMKRCLLQDDGTINYYIDTDNPIMKDGTTVTTSDTTDGTTANKLVDTGADFVTDGIVAGQFAYNSTDDTYSIITAVDDLNTLSLERDIFVSGELYDIGTANFGGADGQVMVETPKFYFNHTLVSTTNSWYISKYDLPGYELHPAFWKDGQQVDYRYMSAFEGGMYDASTGTMCAKASIPSSIYASGDKMTSVAGTWAKTNETRAEYRTMAAQRGTGWRQLDYYLHSAVQLLYLVEYANFNSQTMIGGGRSNLTGGGWTADSYIGLTGLSIPDGNGTNSVMSGTLYDIDGTGYATDYMTYRGIENLFGNVWKMVDGITWDGTWTGSAAAQPVYVTNNSTYFADQVSTNMQHLCDAPYIGAASDYIGNIVNVTGFIPSAGGGTATEEICDYYYQYSEVGRDYWRVVLVGGGAFYGGEAGVFSLDAYGAWSDGRVAYGGRLCF